MRGIVGSTLWVSYLGLAGSLHRGQKIGPVLGELTTISPRPGRPVGLGSSAIHFSLSDASLPGHVSSVDRVLERFPDMQRFFDESSIMPAPPAARRLTSLIGHVHPSPEWYTPEN